MKDLLFSLIYCLFFLATSLLVVGMFYWPSYIQWIQFSKNCYEIFGDQPNFDKICFVIKESKWKYWIGIYFCGILNIGSFWLFLWMWTGNPNNNPYWIIAFTVSFILSYGWLYFLTKKFLNEIKKIGIYSKAKAIENFLELKEKNSNFNSKKLTFFTLMKDEKKASRNFPFQFNQKRYKRKIEKLLNKKNNHKQDIRLLNMFVRYLKAYSVFLKSMQKEEGKYTIEIDNQIYDIEKLPEILINNFFAYTQI